MTFALCPPVKAALVERLGDDLPAVLDAINSESADGVSLDMPPAERITPYVPSVGLLRQWPAIGVQELPSRFEDDIGSSAVAVHELAVVAFESDADLAALNARLGRWQQAIATVVLRDRELGVGGADAYGVQLVQTRPGPTLGDSEDPERVKTYVSWTAVLFRLRSVEQD